jgi:hypothetical protein
MWRVSVMKKYFLKTKTFAINESIKGRRVG